MKKIMMAVARFMYGNWYGAVVVFVAVASVLCVLQFANSCVGDFLPWPKDVHILIMFATVANIGVAMIVSLCRCKWGRAIGLLVLCAAACVCFAFVAFISCCVPTRMATPPIREWTEATRPFARMMLVSTLALAAGCVSTLKVDNAPVAALDLNRYLGEWYEIARFDHSFERGVEQAKANYTQNADGTIKVVNSGIKNGKPMTAIGKGKTTDTPGLLRVSFFGPFYADYRVMLIDKNYTYALVGSGNADYLWILSRTPGLSETAKSELLSEAKRRGYDTGKLIWVEQK